MLVVCVLAPNTLAQWTSDLVDDELTRAYGVGIGDLNSDGHIDIVASGNLADRIVWYDGSDGVKHLIQDRIDAATMIEIADVNDDGVPDVVANL